MNFVQIFIVALLALSAPVSVSAETTDRQSDLVCDRAVAVLHLEQTNLSSDIEGAIDVFCHTALMQAAAEASVIVSTLELTQKE